MQLGIGRRWLGCGARLFARNPWLLGGMGFTSALLLAVLALIPLAGALLIALLAPLLLASASLALDGVARQKAPLPAALRVVALKKSPRELLAVFRAEDRWLPAFATGLYSLAVVLLANLLVELIAGNAWVGRWAGLDPAALAGVLTAALALLLIYFALAASLVYALPLAFLQDEALIPAIGRSLRAGLQYPFGLLPTLALLLVPSLFAALAGLRSAWLAPLVWVLLGAVVLPLATASAYCSYRTLFAVKAEVSNTERLLRR
jgi:hypothetical protein